MATASPAKRKGKWVPPSRYDAFLNGELSVEDLDMEELMRGQLRDKHGTFTGKPPLMIPRAFHQKLAQEMLHRAEGKIREHFDEAMEVFIEVMRNPRNRAQDRLYAAQYIWERMAGKIPEQQVVHASIKKWEDVAEAILVDVVDDNTIDAEVVSDTVEPTYGVRFDDDEPLAIEATPAPAAPRRPTRRKKKEEAA